MAGGLAELLATQRLPCADTGTGLQRQLVLPHQHQQHWAAQGPNAGRAQLRRRLLSFVRAACKQQRLQWQRHEDLSEMLGNMQQEQPTGHVDYGDGRLREKLLALLQLDSQLQLQQQRRRTNDSNPPTATPGTGPQHSSIAAAAAVRRYLLRLLASPIVAAARSRHRFQTAGAAISAIKREWKHQYGELVLFVLTAFLMLLAASLPLSCKARQPADGGGG